MRTTLDTFLQELNERTEENDQYPVLTSSKSGLYLQSDYFNKQVASRDNTGYKIIRRGQFTYRAMSDTGEFFPNMLECADVGIVSPAYPVFKISRPELIDPNYLKYFFRSDSFQHSIASFAQGSTRTSVKFGKMKTVSIELPDLEMQARIIEILDRASKIIEIKEAEIEKLDELIKARFVELFGRPEDKKYPSVRLGDYAKLQGGYAFKSKDFVDEGVPLVQIGNVNKDYLDWDVINAVPEEYIDKYSEFALSKDDLVMAMTRPIIKSLGSVKIAKVAEDDLPCLLNQRVGRFQIKDKIHPVFLEILCKTDDFKDYVERMSGNSLQPNISSKQVEDYIIILPPIELQEIFAEFVKQVDKSKFVA